MDEPYKIFLRISDYETASPDSGKYPVIPGETPSSKVYFCMENRSPAIHRCYNMHGYARSGHPDTSLNLKNPVLLSNARTHQGNYRSPSDQLPRCKHSSTVLGSYVAAHSTCLLFLLTQAQKRGMKVSLSLPLHIIEHA